MSIKCSRKIRLPVLLGAVFALTLGAVAPQASTPDECAEGVPLPVVIAWNEVTTTIDGEPIEVVEYQVLAGDVIDALTTGTTLTIPDGLLEEGTSYNFEVLAIADNGNQTITEGCFVTAD